jgi:hypothetical protein
MKFLATPPQVRRELQCPGAPVRNTAHARNAMHRDERESEALRKLNATIKAQDREARYGVHESAIVTGVRERVPSTKYGFWN